MPGDRGAKGAEAPPSVAVFGRPAASLLDFRQPRWHTGTMRKWVKIALVICAFTLAGQITWHVLAPGEPAYHGKSLRYWLKGYHAANGSWNTATPQAADEAVRHLGTNAIPVLLKMLAEKDSASDIRLLRWSHTWRRWAGKLPLVHVSPIPHLHSYESIEALQAFRALGSAGVGAVPELTRQLDLSPPPGNQGTIELVLAFIGPAAKEAVPALLRRLQDVSPNTRGNSLFALGCIHADSELVVPEATKALGDPDPHVRTEAATALRAYGTKAHSSVPALVEAVKQYSPVQQASLLDPDDPVIAAKEALKAIDPEVAAKAGVE